MGALREKMVAEMKLRNFASRDTVLPLPMVGLAKHYRQLPDQLTQEQIRTYLLHLQERGCRVPGRTWPSRAAVFLSAGFGWTQEQIFCHRENVDWRLPEVLSPREVERLLAAAVKLR